MTTAAVIVARMSSTRLPNKHLKKINNKPMVQVLFERLKASQNLDNILLATSDDPTDDSLADFSESIGLSVYRGSLVNVMSRIGATAKTFGANTVVEILGDNPLVQATLIDDVIDEYYRGNYDYCAAATSESITANRSKRLFSLGLGVQVYSQMLAEQIGETIDFNDLGDRHPTSVIYNNPDRFRTGFLEATGKWAIINHPNLNLAVNTAEDLRGIEKLINDVSQIDRGISLKGIFEWVNQNLESLPQWLLQSPKANENLLEFDKQPYIIAEIASAHQGDEKKCYELIDDSARSGALGVKFQFYKYDVLSSPIYEKRKIHEEIHFDESQRISFVQHATEIGLDVWIDIFDRWGLDVAYRVSDSLRGVKVPPTVLLDEELVKQILGLGKPTLIGVGGYDDHDIDFILDIVSDYRDQIILLYGYQGYPTQEEDTCLSRIPYLRDRYDLPIGFADHVDANDSLALLLPEYAYFSGAVLIEKHITRNRKAKGYDYSAALEPDEFTEMVARLKRCSRIRGGVEITNAQKDYLANASRVTVLEDMAPGDLLSLKNTNFRRTGETESMLPNEGTELLPCVVRTHIPKDHGVSRRHIKEIRVGAIVLCRSDSQRLPGKSQMQLDGVAAVERCLINANASNQTIETILATSDADEDSPLSRNADKTGSKFFQGSGLDPLKRMIDAAEKFELDVVVRITGDSPLVSYELIDLLVEEHCENAAEYSKVIGAPQGVKAEVINVNTLRKIDELRRTEEHGEYLSLYFENNVEMFRTHIVECPNQFHSPELRLSLDYTEDYDSLVQIYENLKPGSHPTRLDEVLACIGDLKLTNQGIIPLYRSRSFAEDIDKKFSLN